MQPGSERLLEAHEQVPRPELPPVRVTGQLQIVTGCCGRRGRTGLMREEDFCARVLGCTRESRCRIAALCRVEVMGAVVSYAGDDQRFSVVGHDRVLIEQDLEA